MAKRKRRKTSTKQTLELKTEVYALLFIIIAIIGLGKLGPVGRIIMIVADDVVVVGGLENDSSGRAV